MVVVVVVNSTKVSIPIIKRPKGIAFVIKEEKLRASKKKAFQLLTE